MNTYYSTYCLETISGAYYVIYDSGHAEDYSHTSIWVVTWPEGYWS
jgi:hypothetical protein